MNKSRVSKDPEIRKNEIIDTAAELFVNKGFEETSVSDIVQKVGVAQGLFYYYFKSKDEILNAVVDRFADAYVTKLQDISNDPELSSIQKIHKIMAWMFSLTQNDKLVQYVHQERNELLHHRLTRKWLERINQIFLITIEQGIREKVFQVEYPQETVEILMAGLEPYLHNALRRSNNAEQFYQKIQASLAVIEKALGAAKGSLQNIELLGK